jgi:hypothetical protein
MEANLLHRQRFFSQIFGLSKSFFKSENLLRFEVGEASRMI